MLFGVLSVWGLVIFKIVSGVNSSEPELTHNFENLNYKSIQPTTKDTFSITELERDPFLGTIKVKRTNNLKIKSDPKKVDVPIKFKGVVSAAESSNQVFIINIANQDYLFKKGQRHADVKLMSGTSEKIRVQTKYGSKVVLKE